MQEVIEYAFGNPGATQRAIAQHFGVTEQRISAIMKAKRIQENFPLFARQERRNLIRPALAVERELLEKGKNEEVRRKVVASVYADHGISENQTPTTQINVFQTLSSDDLMRKVEQITVAHGEVVDTEIVEGPDTP